MVGKSNKTKCIWMYTQISCLYNWTKICITNYNILTSSRMWIQSLDVLHNEHPLILHFENFDARFVTWSCTNDLQLLRESDRFNSSSLRAHDCLDVCTASGLLLHLERLVPNELPELSIYRAQVGCIWEEFNLFFF